MYTRNSAEAATYMDFSTVDEERCIVRNMQIPLSPNNPNSSRIETSMVVENCYVPAPAESTSPHLLLDMMFFDVESR